MAKRNNKVLFFAASQQTSAKMFHFLGFYGQAKAMGIHRFCLKRKKVGYDRAKWYGRYDMVRTACSAVFKSVV